MSQLSLHPASTCVLFIVLLACAACGTTSPGLASPSAEPAGPFPTLATATVTPHPPFAVARQAGPFTLFSMEGDQQALEDVAGVLLDYAPRVGRDLDYDYDVPAADLFAFSAVDFIATGHGLKALNRLIRSPGALEDILGLSRAEFEQQWRQFMVQNDSSPG
jgi:hypothetical protein